MADPIKNQNSHENPHLSYWQRAQEPLQALIFLLPLIAFYELGAAFLSIDRVRSGLRMSQFRELPSYLKSRQDLIEFFAMFGISSPYLPGLAVLAVLLCWHWVKRDRCGLRWKFLGLMWAESMLLSLPLFVFSLVLARRAAATGTDAQTPAELNSLDHIVLSVGAGIYEELVFRLIGIALLHWLLVDWLGVPMRWGAAATIGVTSIAFSLYHFSSNYPFAPGLFVFYTVAGIYFAAIYLLRGFGIVVAVHALYDIFVVLLKLQYRYG